MTTLKLTPIKTQNGLGCLNGISCPNCNAPLVDTLSGKPRKTHIKDAYCPMCEITVPYNVHTRTTIVGTFNLN